MCWQHWLQLFWLYQSLLKKNYIRFNKIVTKILQTVSLCYLRKQFFSSEMAGIATVLYNTIYKRTSTFALTILASSFFFERAFDIATENLYDYINRGKQWKDIKDNYQ